MFWPLTDQHKLHNYIEKILLYRIQYSHKSLKFHQTHHYNFFDHRKHRMIRYIRHYCMKISQRCQKEFTLLAFQLWAEIFCRVLTRICYDLELHLSILVTIHQIYQHNHYYHRISYHQQHTHHKHNEIQGQDNLKIQIRYKFQTIYFSHL